MSHYIYLSCRSGPLARAHLGAKLRRSLRRWWTVRSLAANAHYASARRGLRGEPLFLKIPSSYVWTKKES